MNEEEKKAKEYLNNYKYDNEVRKSIDIILNLIEKLQKANKELTKSNKALSKTVNLMAKHIYSLGYYDCLYEECDDDMDRECEDCIKEYFYKKAKETKDNGSTRNI